MEVEIEDLHLQIDDIVKAKAAVRIWVCRASQESHDGGSLPPEQGPSAAWPLPTFMQKSRPPLLCFPPLSTGPEGAR